MERGDPRVRALVESVADTVGQRLAAVTTDIQDVIQEAIPGLQADESARLLFASIGENVDAAIRAFVDVDGPASATAPAAAVDYARRLAQQDVPATLLIRAYRVGQARFLHHCIEELLRQTPGDHLEGLATLEMSSIVSNYVDHVVELVLTTYAQARDSWLRDRSAVLAMRVRELVRGEPVDVPATEPRSTTASTSTTSPWWSGWTSPPRRRARTHPQGCRRARQRVRSGHAAAHDPG